MAEQISRRSNNVTSAPFDTPFENQIQRFGAGTLNLKDSLDAMEGWSRLTNIWHQNEGEATARPGQTAFATFGGTSSPVHSVRKLRDPASGTFTRIWGVGNTVQHGASGAITSVGPGYSGDPVSLVPHRPTLSGDPWMYVGDRSKMVKVRNDGLAFPIGLPAPAAPTAAPGTEYRRSIATFSAADSTAAGSWTGVAGSDEHGNASGVPTIVGGFGIPGGTTPEIYVTTVDAAVDSPYDSWVGIGLTRDLTTLSPVPGPGADIPASDDDLIHFWMKTSHPHLIEEIRVYIVVSSAFNATVLPGIPNVTGYNSDAYVKGFRQN